MHTVVTFDTSWPFLSTSRQ